MKRSTFNAIGGWQPFLFCIGMYVVALFFSIFVCSAIFYAFNSTKPFSSTGKETAKTTIITTASAAQHQLAAIAR